MVVSVCMVKKFCCCWVGNIVWKFFFWYFLFKFSNWGGRNIFGGVFLFWFFFWFFVLFFIKLVRLKGLNVGFF